MEEKIRNSRELTISAVKNLFFQILLNISKDSNQSKANSNLWDTIENIDTLRSLTQYTLQELNRIESQRADANIVADNIQRIISCINQNYSDSSFSLDKLAKMVYLSPQYICKIFKKSMGETVNSYIIRIRMEKAKELLKDPSVKLSSIAKQIGYSSPNHFAKLFKNQEGMNPSEYQRLKCRKMQ